MGKHVVLREEYLKRLIEIMYNDGRRRVPSIVPDLMDMLRLCTVETCEAIAHWRASQEKPIPFIWNGINYLLKMPSDLDVLQHFKPMKTWLGFSLDRNPMMIPLPMEQRPSSVSDKP